MRGFRTIMSALATLALIAAPLAAQGGPGRGHGPAMGRGMMQGGPDAMARNPAAVVLEHRDALELTAEQVQALETMQAEIEEQNGPRWAQLEEAFGDADPAGMSVEERQALRERMQELAPVREAIRQTNRTIMAGLHEMLTPEQEQKLRAVMRRAPDRPGRGMRAGRPGSGAMGAAYRTGFRHGWAGGWRAADRGGPAGPCGG